MFLQHLMQHHVVNFFANDRELAAKVKLSIGNYKHTHGLRKLKADVSGFIAQRTPDQPTTDDDFDAQVNRAVSLAQDDIEQIVRRALELHDAQRQVQQPQAGQYVEDERDGRIIAQPIWGEPLRRTPPLSSPGSCVPAGRYPGLPPGLRRSEFPHFR